ncbi:LuxR family transcriptional regulator [Pseudonocardia nematodicida]|uniref:LuxR family transcriptional regulator n=1 Tax=Pseudonocardia nematodicida TaxID=1206997 RepID=A0ABV1KLL2_9PSEU
MRGRATERARIGRLLASARDGRAAVLEIVGDPGIGKTALVEHAAAADGFRVLRARGVQGEVELPLAGLDELLRPLAGAADDLPPAPRSAVRALHDGTGPAGDVSVLGAATLGLLARAAEAGPVLVVLDDAHWLDDQSGRVLSFALRRLAADAVAVLLARRTGERRPVAGPWPSLDLAGLSSSDAGALFTPGTAGSVRAALHAATGGNPLALREVDRVLTAAQRSGRDPLPDPLPLTGRGTAAFGPRFAGLHGRTRLALAVLAAAGPAGVGSVAAALGRLGLTPADLEPAERAGVLTVAPGRPEFVHPLVRAAAFAVVSPADRRRAHDALARVTDGSDVQRYALHLAAAAVVGGTEVATALDRAASDAERRGGPAAGAAARVRAAALSPDGPERDTRRVAAARSCLLAGRRDEAAGLVGEVLATGHDAGVRQQALALRAAVAVWRTDVAGAVPELYRVHDELAGPAPDLAAMVSVQLATALGSIGRLVEMLALTRRALALETADPLVRYLLEHMHTHARLLHHGELGAVLELEEHFPAARFVAATRERFPTHQQMVTQVHTQSERFAEARAVVDEQMSAARTAGIPARLPMPLMERAELLLFTGDPVRAIADLGEVTELGPQVGADGMLGYAHAQRARAAAVAGDVAGARRHGELALTAARRLGQPPVLVYARHALGLAELAADRPQVAAEHLTGAREVARSTGLGNPLTVPFGGDLVEALHRAGRADDAAAALVDLAADAARTGSRWARGVAARCRILLDAGAPVPDGGAPGGTARPGAPPDGAVVDDPGPDGAAGAALADLAEHPFDHGRTLLVIGTALRRARRVRAARDRLAAAVAELDRCGSPGWADRARAELRAAGVRPAGPTGGRAGTALTGQELRVCLAVAEGGTNREVAGALFVSPKTVEHHLGRAFAKLGVTTRAQLARLVAEGALRSDGGGD